MRKSNEPSSLRKIIVTIAATFGTLALFGLLFGASYLIAPATKGVSSSSNYAPNGQTPSHTVDIAQHIHSALMIYVNGKRLDFSSSQYQYKDIRINFENGDGITLHKPDHDANIGQLLDSLNMTVANNCLTLSYGSSYCSNFDTQVSLLVNGQPEGDFQHYVPIKNDKILISYGKSEEINGQLQQLNSAIIRS